MADSVRVWRCDGLCSDGLLHEDVTTALVLAPFVAFWVASFCRGI